MIQREKRAYDENDQNDQNDDAFVIRKLENSTNFS